MAEVLFIHAGVPINVQCKFNDKMKDIIKKLKEKVKIRSGNIYYLYNGAILNNEEFTFEQIANQVDKNRKKMSITIIEDTSDIKKKEIIKSKNIICPECKENIRMDIKEYKINLSKCKNGHNIENILFNEFEETQNINLTEITCDICKKINKGKTYNNEFHKCLTCNKNICPLCKSNHDNNHKIIYYDEKYYKCSEHNDDYIAYCEDCKKNLCSLCDGHKVHKRLIFMDILPKKEDLIEKINEIKSTIDKFNNQMRVLINILNDVKDKINMYYKIYEDIINNYDNKNRNYEIIYNINQLQNNKIKDELDKIIESNIIEKYKNIFNIYQKMNIDEINIIYNIKDLNQVQLFDSIFIEKNKNNLKLIIDGKELELIGIYQLINNNENILKVKLKGITTVTDMSYIFRDCSSLISLPDISKWDTINVTDMSYIFSDCSTLIYLPDISKWNTINVTDMSLMFYGCSSLISLPDISNWNTTNVNNMSYIFNGCSSLISLPDISKWNTINVTDMRFMFSGCSSLLSLPDISKWNTTKATNMSLMFYGCASLTYLPDISNWNTTNVTDMSRMFDGCKSSLNIPFKFKKY